jgi:hypothetical protein
MTQQTYPIPPQGRPAPQYGPPTAPYGPPPTGFGQPPAPRRRRTGLIVGSVVAAVVVLAGLVVGALLLFGSKTLNTAEAERQIAQLTEAQAGVAPADVSCPADIEAEAGGTFACSATLEDQPISFSVTQTDDEGNVEIDGDNTFVDIATVEASLDEQLGEVSGVTVVSTCDADGHSVLVDAVGTPIPCTVVNAGDASDSIEVAATVDESGEVSYEVL